MSGKLGRSGGRNRKPSFLRTAEGNPGHRPIPPEPAHDGTRPEPSSRLTPGQAAMFEEIASREKHLTAADTPMLERYVVAEMRRRRIESHISATGDFVLDRKRGMIRNPGHMVLAQCQRELNVASASLRLGSFERARLAAERANQPKRLTWQEIEPMTRLFSFFVENADGRQEPTPSGSSFSED